MKPQECMRNYYPLVLLFALGLAALAMSGCTNAEAAKREYINRGEAFLKDKKFQEASLEFRNAIQLDENLAAAHWGLVQAYEGLQRYNEAFDELKRTVDLDATNLDARVKLGNYYLSNPNPTPEAIAQVERLASDVLQKDPKHIEGHILMASVLYQQDKDHPEKALAELNRAIELDPKRVESHLSLARFYIRMKEAGKAEEAFRHAIALNDASALAHVEYGKFLVQSGRSDSAEGEFKKGVEVEPSNRDARFVLASFYFSNKQTEKAEAAYKALADLDPNNLDGRAVLADFYSAVGRLDEAANIYQDIVTKSPDYARGHYRLGEIMLQRGDTKGATAQVDEVLKKNEHDMEGLLLRARIRMQSSRPDDIRAAIEDLKDVLKQEPRKRAGLYFMAEANFRLGRVEQARAFAGDLERYYPDYLPAKLMQAQINLAASDPKTALRLSSDLIDRLAKATPDKETSPQLLDELRARAFTSRGSAELQLGDTRAARQDFSAARDATPNDPGSYVNLAAVALNEKKQDEAISFYERALAIDSADFNALNGLINTYASQNHLDQAHARVDKALGVQPNNPSLHYLKAQVYGYEKSAQGAEAELRRALEIDPNYLAAYSALGGMFANMNRQEDAIKEYRKIIEKRPDDATAYTLIGILEDSRQNHDAAIENYRRAIQWDPNAAIAANNLAWSYAVYGKGNLDEAMQLAQGVVQRYPDVAGFADTLGWIYYKKSLPSAAVDQLQKAVARDSGSPTYHYHLGMALADKGDKTSARRELEQALRLGQGKNFADADEARKALATL